MMSEWIDVSAPIRPGMPVWPGDPPIEMQILSSVADGAAANVSRWSIGTHTGTHVDPPRHFIAGGRTVLEMPLRDLCGPAFIADVRGVRPHVTAQHLEQAVPDGVRRILLRTDNSAADGSVFHEDFVALTPDAADWLLRKGIALVGIDGPSVEAFRSPGHPVHHALLGAGISVIEGLRLDGIAPGPYEMVCAPLPLTEADGAPARVFIRRTD